MDQSIRAPAAKLPTRFLQTVSERRAGRLAQPQSLQKLFVSRLRNFQQPNRSNPQLFRRKRRPSRPRQLRNRKQRNRVRLMRITAGRTQCRKSPPQNRSCPKSNPLPSPRRQRAASFRKQTFRPKDRRSTKRQRCSKGQVPKLERRLSRSLNNRWKGRRYRKRLAQQ